MSNKVETIERKDPIVQLKASKLSIKNFFKVFKYQVTVKPWRN